MWLIISKLHKVNLREKTVSTVFSKEIQLPPSQIRVSKLKEGSPTEFIISSSTGIQVMRIQSDMRSISDELSISSSVRIAEACGPQELTPTPDKRLLPITSFAIAKKNTQIYAASYDGTISIWDTQVVPLPARDA